MNPVPAHTFIALLKYRKIKISGRVQKISLGGLDKFRKGYQLHLPKHHTLNTLLVDAGVSSGTFPKCTVRLLAYRDFQ